MTGSILARRVQGFGTSIFTEISALAVQHGAINLGQGFPDFAGPQWVKQAACDAIAADLNQYAPASGLPQLKQAIADHWARSGWREIDPASEVTITSGATEALCSAILALVDPGDEVILFEPAYDAYGPDVTLAGGVARYVTLYPPEAQYAGTEPNLKSKTQNPTSDWWFDADELRAAFNERTKAILVNTPHNPTGKVFSRGELELIAALCQEHDVQAITDEVYDQLVFDGAQHLPLALLPGMWERTLTINSTGKTFSVTGWKIGYGVGPAHLSHALRQSHQWVTFATATPFQQAAAVALETAPERGYYQELRAEYLARRELLTEVLHAAGLPTLPARGSYFLMADIGAVGQRDDAAFCRWLTAEVGVAAIPPSVFYADPARAQGRHAGPPLLARFCFAKSLDTIRAAGERLRNLRLIS
jgi:aspartate/methionine/tyrosine aminotransferase